MVIIPAATFFSHTAVKYVAFKYSEVVAIQINETMLGNKTIFNTEPNYSITLKYWNSSWHHFWPVLTCAINC